MAFRTLHLAPFLLVAFCATVAAVRDNFERPNEDTNTNFNQNCPSFIFEINR